MAKSVQTSSYNGRYLQLTVSEESYDVASNKSVVRWTLQSTGGSANYYTIYNWGVWVNGSTIYGTQTTYWNSYNFPAATGSTTGTIEVAHNADGSIGDIGFELKGCVFYNRNNSYSDTLPLTQGNRGTSVSQSLSSKTPNSITMNWSTGNTADYIWYSIDNGSSWVAVGSVNASNGSYTISGLSANTSYNIKTRARRKDTQRDNNYSEATAISTYKTYSYVTSATVGNLMPFTCTAYCTSSNAANTNSYEYTLCNSSQTAISTQTVNATSCNFTGLAEETTYYIRCRVKSTDSGVWSGYVYSAAFTTPPDQAKGYIKVDGTWKLGKVYIKVNGSWVKAKKAYLKYGGAWNISRNP